MPWTKWVSLANNIRRCGGRAFSRRPPPCESDRQCLVANSRGCAGCERASRCVLRIMARPYVDGERGDKRGDRRVRSSCPPNDALKVIGIAIASVDRFDASLNRANNSPRSTCAHSKETLSMKWAALCAARGARQATANEGRRGVSPDRSASHEARNTPYGKSRTRARRVPASISGNWKGFSKSLAKTVSICASKRKPSPARSHS
jgi:hypothetical protein